MPYDGQEVPLGRVEARPAVGQRTVLVPGP